MLQLRTAGAELAAERELVELLRKSETDLVEGYEAQVLAKTEQEEALRAEVIETKLAEMHAEHLHREEEMDASLTAAQKEMLADNHDEKRIRASFDAWKAKEIKWHEFVKAAGGVKNAGMWKKRFTEESSL